MLEKSQLLNSGANLIFKLRGTPVRNRPASNASGGAGIVHCFATFRRRSEKNNGAFRVATATPRSISWRIRHSSALLRARLFFPACALSLSASFAAPVKLFGDEQIAVSEQ